MGLEVRQTPLPGVLFLLPDVFADARGFFTETWNQRDWTAAGVAGSFVQDAHSRSVRGVVRGLHFQDANAPLSKLVRCTVGRVFDVAVDVRGGSPTFGRWHAVELTAENKAQLFVPAGFAHGFQALTDVAEVQYKQTGYYAPAAEGILAWDDPDLAISWPLRDALLSERDRHGHSLQALKASPPFRYALPG